MNYFLTPDTLNRSTLEKHVTHINGILLNDNVPKEIKEQFDTVKELLLFSWFRHRFETIALLQAIATLEFTLRYKLYGDGRKEGPNLTQLLDIAITKKWLIDKGFTKSNSFEQQINKNNLPKLLAKTRNSIAHGKPYAITQTYFLINIVVDAINQLF
jgi:hypothetical protein